MSVKMAANGIRTHIMANGIRSWVRIPFAAIFADILGGRFKIITPRLLFSNLIWRLLSLAKRAACLTV